MRRLLLSVFAALACAALTAPSAGAALFCAGDGSVPSCPGGTGVDNLEDAIDLVEVAGAGPHTIILEAATYDEDPDGLLSNPPFQYEGTADLTIEGPDRRRRFSRAPLPVTTACSRLSAPPAT